MKKIVTLLTILITLSVNALEIPKGTFYFDNSLTRYSHVKFVYGSDTSAETHIISMTMDENNRWKITIPETISDMYRYTFAETSLPDGKINKTFSTIKEEISKTYNEYRTATTDKTILVGGIFVPETGDNWAQGNWQTLSNNSFAYSGTLPVMFIETENNEPITSTETYINASYRLDNMGIDDIEPIATADSMFAMQIRGRGNYTWRDFEKKPYRIKLDKKAALLGMNKSKHFALLAHADDNMAFLRNTVGLELSRRIGLAYTPAQQPVEVVLNGDYIGLYFLTETIRVANDRVNIVEQPDTATAADIITGGWLVEIDNYDDDSQIRITEGNGEIIRFTYKTPELLSNKQESYLRNQVTAMNSAIYNSNKNSTAWEGYIDIDSLARFYIVQEIMDNAESFHGSCYLHKDKGIKKWIFGPVWDFGNSYHRSNGQFIYQNPPFGQTWIGEIAKYPRFQQKVIEIWKWFKGNRYDGLDTFIDNFTEQIAIAAQYDALRWPNYGNYDIYNRKNNFTSMLDDRVNWLVSQWGEGINNIDDITNSNIIIKTSGNGEISVYADSPILSIKIYNLSGIAISNNNPHVNNYSIDCPLCMYIGFGNFRFV